MIPIFGKKLDKEPRKRAAAYAVIIENDKIVVVYDSNKMCFLPGGGIKLDETAEEAVLREIREECGRIAEINGFIGDAIQYFTSSKGEYYRMRVHFYICSFKSDPSLEAEHLVAWQNPRDLQFIYESFRWE